MYTFVDQDGGPLRVFRLPEEGMVYTLGIDASTGLAEDYSSMQVLSNTIPFEQVAAFRAKWSVNDVTAFADKLGRFYNEALIICEINYPGNSVQDALLQFYKYPRNYQPETHLSEDIDISCNYGFRTTEPTKWLLINEMQLALQNKEIKLNDPVTIAEFYNFVYQADKKTAAAPKGLCDDTVMAMMLAYHGAKLYPFIKPLKKKEDFKEDVIPEARRMWREFRAKLMTGTSNKGKLL
jgi:hypothetical protein